MEWQRTPPLPPTNAGRIAAALKRAGLTDVGASGPFEDGSWDVHATGDALAALRGYVDLPEPAEDAQRAAQDELDATLAAVELLPKTAERRLLIALAKRSKMT